MASARYVAAASFAGVSREAHGSELRQRRSTGSSAAAPKAPTADTVVESALPAANAAQHNSRELATMLHRIRQRSIDNRLLTRVWKYHGRTVCCVDIRILTALVCAATIVVNVLLWRMQMRKDTRAQQQCDVHDVGDSAVGPTGDSADKAVAGVVLSVAAASNCFSIFAYAVGLLAACFQAGWLSYAFFCYAFADTLFAIVPATFDVVRMVLRPELIFGSGLPPEAEAGRFMAALLTFTVNFAYNVPCLSVAWTFSQCFERHLSLTANDDSER